ncbi:MAG: DUF1559 domain-containing protein, partial [Pirellulales bacterium]|nr:DUF1559 domain-containing protein [Pirellulales bacterium]
IALLLPAVQATREAARRACCANRLRQLGLAVHNYTTANGALPSGCVLSGVYPDAPPWDPLWEASKGKQGASWMLAILPYLEQQPLYGRWDFDANVLGNREVAQTNIALFYCPSRRSGITSETLVMCLPGFEGGGNDYGGCLGRDNSFQNACRRTYHACSHAFVDGQYLDPTSDKIGVFSPNSHTRPNDITDGNSQTIMLGEMQRLLPPPDATGFDESNAFSTDGWALAGVATLFTTAVAGEGTDVGQPGGFNNGFFESAGSEHPGGAQFTLADGSVLFLDTCIDAQVYAWYGSLRDGQAFEPY